MPDAVVGELGLVRDGFDDVHSVLSAVGVVVHESRPGTPRGVGGGGAPVVTEVRKERGVSGAEFPEQTSHNECELYVPLVVREGVS